MTRDGLFELALKCGIKEDKQKAVPLIKQELIKYFSSDKGKQEIQNAPKISIEGNDDFPLNKPETIANLLLQEVESFDFTRIDNTSQK